jgi:hypothetical protein
MSVLIVGLFLLSVLPVTSVFANSPPSCSVIVNGENITNNAIQTAIINAETHVTGPIVCVTPGTYPEQLVIDTSGITLRGLPTSGHPVLIQPTSVSPDSISPDSSAQQSNIILVTGEAFGITGDIVTGLTVDGSLASSSFNSCSVDYEGILFLDAGGSISGNTVENIYLPVADAGCQPGDAILVQTSASYYYSVSITNNRAINYNKNGITCNDLGTTCWIKDNTVYPYAPYTDLIAPNGIQVAFGAKGQVTDNTVSGNVCTLISVCGPDPFTQTESCGILTIQSATGTTINDNNVKANQLGICLVNDEATANHNNFHGNIVAGLYLYDPPVSYSASKNTFNGNPIGIVIQSDGCTSSCGNVGYTGSYTANIDKSYFFSTPIKAEIATMNGAVTGAVIVHFVGQTYSLSGDQTVTIV